MTDAKTYESVDEWRAEAIRRFGEEPMDWRFACPSCGHEQSVRDYKEAGAPEGVVAFSCVGRYMDDSVTKVGELGEGQAPCNYAGGGLFKLNPITIVDHGTVFAFADVVCLGCGGTECGHVGCKHGKQSGA